MGSRLLLGGGEGGVSLVRQGTLVPLRDDPVTSHRKDSLSQKSKWRKGKVPPRRSSVSIPKAPISSVFLRILVTVMPLHSLRHFSRLSSGTRMLTPRAVLVASLLVDAALEQLAEGHHVRRTKENSIR